jgi:pimeloyl-ACP methyl ester carboxylesterase
MNILPEKNSAFGSPAGEAAFTAAYNATLALWPVTPEPMNVATRFGLTHLNASGPAGAPPLVLLPGGLMNSTCWYMNVANLSRHFRIYALDTMGDYGLSVLQRKLKDRRDSARWLEDVLDGLKIERAHVAGHSYGGWQACNFALLAPERVDRLVLLAPAETLLPIWKFFYFHAMPVVMVPSRSRVNSFVQHVSATPDAAAAFKEVAEQIYMGVKTIHIPRTVAPTIFSDEELQRLVAPTLLLIGDKEVIYAPQAAFERAARLIPNLETELVQGAGHDLMRDQPARVDRSLIEFLQKEAVASH